MKKILILLLFLSLLTPSFHFIVAKHTIDPFSNKLSHIDRLSKNINKIDNNNSITKGNLIDKHDDNCNVSLFNSFINISFIKIFHKSRYYSYNYSYKNLCNDQKLTFIDILCIAPKNSPPIV